MSRLKFNLVTSGLSDYIDETRTELLYQLQMASDLAPYSTVESGIKSSRDIQFMTTTATWQSNGCSYNASDATTFSTKNLSVADIAIMEDICPKLLNGFWAEQLIRKGAEGDNVLPAEIARVWMDKKLNIIKKQINEADWQGDTGSGTAYLNKYDGLLKLIFADASTIDGNPDDETSVDLTNILDVMDAMYLTIPEDLRAGAPDGSQLKWFLPQAWYDLYVIAGRNENLFHWDIKEGFLKFYGTNIDLVPQSGLAGTDKMVIMPENNILLGMDGEGDDDTLKYWWSEDDQINHSKLAFKRGINYKFSDYIVRFGLGAS